MRGSAHPTRAPGHEVHRPAPGLGTSRGVPVFKAAMDPRPAIRVFLLSPASLSGVRGRRLLDGGSGAPFAGALADGGAPIGDVYEFVSSLYFRGKRAYAEAFARPPAGSPGALVITSALGLVPLDRPVTAGSLAELASVAIDPGEPRYVEPVRSRSGSAPPGGRSCSGAWRAPGTWSPCSACWAGG